MSTTLTPERLRELRSTSHLRGGSTDTSAITDAAALLDRIGDLPAIIPAELPTFTSADPYGPNWTGRERTLSVLALLENSGHIARIGIRHGRYVYVRTDRDARDLPYDLRARARQIRRARDAALTAAGHEAVPFTF